MIAWVRYLTVLGQLLFLNFSLLLKSRAINIQVPEMQQVYTHCINDLSCTVHTLFMSSSIFSLGGKIYFLCSMSFIFLDISWHSRETGQVLKHRSCILYLLQKLPRDKIHGDLLSVMFPIPPYISKSKIFEWWMFVKTPACHFSSSWIFAKGKK